MDELFYLQDKRTICGNSMSWWAIGGHGYTCDIRCAQVWTQEELEKNGYDDANHPKYKPWPKEVVDRLIQWHIDFQDLKYRNNDGSPSKYPHTLKHWRPELCT